MGNLDMKSKESHSFINKELLILTKLKYCTVVHNMEQGKAIKYTNQIIIDLLGRFLLKFHSCVL